MNVRCSAFLSDLSDVRDRFSHTSKQAEEGYVSHLGHHYNVVVQELEQKQSLLLDTMATLTSQATQQERKLHVDMLRKTDSNVSKLSIELGKRKTKKLNNIAEPTPKRKRSNHTEPRKPRSQPRRPQRKSSKPPKRPPPPPTQPSNLVSNPNPMPLSPPVQPTLLPPVQTPQFQSPQQSLFNMTLGDLFTGFQMGATAFQPRVVQNHCTLGSGRPPPLANPSGKIGQRQPPQLPQSFQQNPGPHQPYYGAIHQDFQRQDKQQSHHHQ